MHVKSARLHANGTVQSGKADLVTQLKGNKYNYYIEAKFTDTTGTGKRDVVDAHRVRHRFDVFDELFERAGQVHPQGILRQLKIDCLPRSPVAGPPPP